MSNVRPLWFMSHHEYESYLDSLDERFFVRGSEVHVNFSEPFVINLNECQSVDALLLQTRLLVVRLIEEPNIHIQYLCEQLVRFTSSFHKLAIAQREMAKSIGFIKVDDTIYSPHRDGDSNRIVLRFENGVGKYAGHHFVELDRIAPDRIQITRNMIGCGEHKQRAEVSILDVVETNSHLLLFLPESTSWQFDYNISGVDSQWHWLHGTRIALRNSFGSQSLSAVLTDLQLLMEGLSFEYSQDISSPAT